MARLTRTQIGINPTDNISLEIKPEANLKEGIKVKTLIIIESAKNIWQCGVEGNVHEAQNVYAESLREIIEKMIAAYSLCGREINITINTSQYSAVFNTDLVGYEIIFKDGKSTQTQFEIEQNALNAGHGDYYMHRYDEYDEFELSDEQESAVDEFISVMNSFAFNSGKL